MADDWLELPLDGFPRELLRVRVTTNWKEGAEARYELAGKRLQGMIRIRYARYGAAEGDFSEVYLGYGDRTSRPDRWRGGYPFNDPPVINGARLGCDGTIIDLTTLLTYPNLAAWRLGARSDYPVLAGRRFTAIVRAVSRHWAARPDMANVRHVAAVHQAVPLHNQMSVHRERLTGQIEDLTTEIAHLDRKLAPITALFAQRDTVLADLGIEPPLPVPDSGMAE
jgi:hypothetical protein